MWEFRRALSRRHLEPVTVVCVGSSSTWGSGAPTVETGWVYRMADRLRDTRLPYSVTYLSHHHDWVFSVPVTTVDGGLSTQSVMLPAGASMHRDVEHGMGAVEVLYRQGPNGAGPFVVDIAGESSTVTPATTGADRYDGVFLHDGPGVPGRITITATTATTITAVRVSTGGFDKGVHVVSAGRGGSTSATYSSRNLALRTHNRVIGRLAPALLVFLAGANDYAADVPPAVYRDRLRTALLYARSSCARSPSILLVHPYRRLDRTAPLAPWSDYGRVLHDLAAELPDTTALDLSAHYPTSRLTDTADLIYSDNIHMTPAGHGFMGDLVGDLVTLGGWGAPSSLAPPPSVDPLGWPGLVSAWNTDGFAPPAGGEVELTSWTPGAGAETSALSAPTGSGALLRMDGPGKRLAVTTTAMGRGLQTATWSAARTGGLSVLAVARFGAPHDVPTGIALTGRNGRYVGLHLIGSNLAQVTAGGTSGASAPVAYLGTGGWKALALVLDPATGTLGLHTHDAEPTISPFTPGAAYGLDGVTIGSNSARSGSFTDAAFTELLVFERALSAVEVDQALAWFARRYALDRVGRTSV